MNKRANTLLLLSIYGLYLVWDYFHHASLAINVSKNMGWLDFLYPHGTFQYSWDILILTPILIGFILYSVMRKKSRNFKPVVIFAVISIAIGFLL